MSRRTKDNKKKSFLRKVQARERIGNYYLGYGTTAASGVEYKNYKKQRGWRLPRVLNIQFNKILVYLLNKERG